MSRKGFTMIEFLIGLTLSLIIILASLEFFSRTKTLFFKIKDAEEDAQAAHSALDKMRIDLARAGRGLLLPMEFGLIQAVQGESEKLTILSAEDSWDPRENLVQGETRIALESAHGLEKGTEICIFDLKKGEIGRVAAIDGATLILSSPLMNSYSKEETQATGLEKICLYLDTDKRTLRRKVNSSPAQPLLEDVATFHFSYEVTKNLVDIVFTLADHKENIYEACIFPKNSGLALER